MSWSCAPNSVSVGPFQNVKFEYLHPFSCLSPTTIISIFYPKSTFPPHFSTTLPMDTPTASPITTPTALTTFANARAFPFPAGHGTHSASPKTSPSVFSPPLHSPGSFFTSHLNISPTPPLITPLVSTLRPHTAAFPFPVSSSGLGETSRVNTT
jgi:hypothetical protein